MTKLGETGMKDSKQLVVQQLPNTLTSFSMADHVTAFVFESDPIFDEPTYPVSAALQNHNLVKQGNLEKNVKIISY